MENTINTIEICHRKLNPGHFHACLENNEGIWADGKSIDEAIGNLIRCHPEIFGIKIEFLCGISR